LTRIGPAANSGIIRKSSALCYNRRFDDGGDRRRIPRQTPGIFTVLLSEPPRSQGDLNFKLFGIPVRVHPMFWLVSALFGLSGTRGNPALMISWVLLTFVSILVHELGHALAARANGCMPWITLYGMGGLASYNETRQTPGQRIAILLAGPGAGFLLAALLVAVLHALGHQVQFELGGVRGIDWQLQYDPSTWPFSVVHSPKGIQQIGFVLNNLLFVNIFWGLVNLLPVYPLDGGQICQQVLLQSGSRDPLLSLKISMFTAGLVAIYAFAKLDQGYMALFFGYLAYSSYAALQAFQGRGGFGGGGW
jgi:stage IV sporulation protein FB